MKIDKYNLDEEIIEQDKENERLSVLIPEAQRIMDEKSELVKRTRSELVKEANLDPQKHLGVAKAKDSLVEAYYRTHKDHIEAKEDFIQAEYEFNQLNESKWACKNKGKRIEELCNLFLNGYYNMPDNYEAVKNKMEKEDKKEFEKEKKRRLNRTKRK